MAGICTSHFLAGNTKYKDILNTMMKSLRICYVQQGCLLSIFTVNYSPTLVQSYRGISNNKGETAPVKAEPASKEHGRFKDNWLNNYSLKRG